jgi:serine/threonine-protein kinase
MTPERWGQIEEIFQAAVERAPEERAAFLDEACAGDPNLRQEVESLLAQDDQKTLLATAISAAAESLSAGSQEMIGQRIGPYRVTGLIGQGGMGMVYRAVRDDDQYQKQVAIKLVKRGMTTDFVLSRFRYERQILANLDHPHIARLLDGGTTEDGLPYFVMECIEGQPITDYCEINQLSIKDRLKLFLPVCSAVQHAHRNLIVHRDLKPSNILVTTDGTPKLLDFGIAKLLHPETTADAVTAAQTMTAMRMMTPDYASPEQVRGEPVTTVTDVYSLGVVLYELLTNQRPHQFKTYTPSEIERVICEQEPEKPSTAVSNPKSKIQNPKLKRRLVGDLDNIVLMAMRKEPGRRYSSVGRLAEDIERYLDGRPVLARQAALGYRAGKFIRRHQVAVGFSAALLVLLVGFAIMMAIQAARIARERDRANQEAVTAEQVTDFLVDLFEVSDPSEARGNTITARELLDQGAEKIAGELKDQPEVQARLIDTMGQVYQKLGLYDRAEPLLEQALALRRRAFGEDHPDVAESLSHMAALRHAKGDLAAAEPLYREAIEQRRGLLGEHPDLATSLNNLAIFLKDKGDYNAAEPVFREALAMRRKLLGQEHSEVATTLDELAVLLKEKGDYAAAEPLYREALAMRRKLLGNEHPDTAISLNNLAVFLEDKGDYAGAEALYREALAMSRKMLGQQHPYVATNLSNLAGVLKKKGDLAGTEPLYREALALKRKMLGDEHPEVAVLMNNLASLLRLTGGYAEAEQLLRQALAIKRKSLGKAHPSVATSVHNVAALLQAKGDCAAAEPWFKEAIEIFRKSVGADHWMVAEARGNYGVCLMKLKRYHEAEENLVASHAALKTTFGDEHERTQKAIKRLIEFYDAWGRPEKAAQYRAMLETEATASIPSDASKKP